MSKSKFCPPLLTSHGRSLGGFTPCSRATRNGRSVCPTYRSASNGFWKFSSVVYVQLVLRVVPGRVRDGYRFFVARCASFSSRHRRRPGCPTTRRRQGDPSRRLPGNHDGRSLRPSVPAARCDAFERGLIYVPDARSFNFCFGSGS